MRVISISLIFLTFPILSFTVSDNGSLEDSSNPSLSHIIKEIIKRKGKEVKRRRPNGRMLRLPPLPQLLKAKGNERTRKRAMWLGLGEAGIVADDLKRLDSNIVYGGYQLRQQNPQLSVREGLIQAARKLEIQYNQEPGHFSSHILPEYTCDESGEIVHNIVGKYKAALLRGRKLDRENNINTNEEPSCSGPCSKEQESNVQMRREQKSGHRISLEELQRQYRERRKKMGLLPGQRMPTARSIPREFKGLNLDSIRRLKLEMLGLGKYGKEAEDLKRIPPQIVLDAFRLRAKTVKSGMSIRQSLKIAAKFYERKNKIQSGRYDDLILSDFTDGRIRSVGVANVAISQRNPREGAVTLEDLLSEQGDEVNNDICEMMMIQSELEEEEQEYGAQNLSFLENPVIPRQKRTERFPVGPTNEAEQTLFQNASRP